MKKFSKLLVALMALIIIVIPLSCQAQDVAISLPEITIIVNGRAIDNNFREYPFILYNSVTYFPMTYDDCAFLGVENNWTAESGNIITKSVSSGVYNEFFDPTATLTPKRPVATIVKTPITVMGTKIDNAKEQYPILSYKNILYFPLTWDWSKTFGWNVIFNDKNDFLEVSTDGFEDSGFYYLYDVSKDGEMSKHEIAKARYGSVRDLRYPSSLSPNYIKNSSANNYTNIFRLLNQEGIFAYNEVFYMGVKEHLVPFFRQKGWFTADEATTKVEEYAKSHSAEEVHIAAERFYELRNSGYDAFTETLYSSDFRVCAVKPEQVAAYKSAGWMTADELYTKTVNGYLKSGNGMAVIELIHRQWGSQIGAENIPKLELNVDYEVIEANLKSAKAKVASKMKTNFEFRSSYINADGDLMILFTAKAPGKKMISSVDLSYDIVDVTGKVINTVRTTIYPYTASFEAGVTEIGTNSIEISHFDYPTAYAVKNVKIHKVNLDSVDNFPMGQG